MVSGPGTIQALPNGWYRCSIQSTTTVTSTYFISIATSALAYTYTGDGASGIYIWGAQIETGSTATAYIPTTTAAVSVFESFWYNQTEGTVFVEVTASPNTSTSYAAISNGTTSQNSTYFDNDTGIIRSVTFSASSAVSVLGLGAIGTVGTGNKLTSAYKANDFAAARNGGTAQTDTSGAVPVSVTQLDIGRNPNAASAAYLSGTIKRLTYWPVRLPNTTLQAITSP